MAQDGLEAVAKVIRPVQDQFYGDRTGTRQDPLGPIWLIATHNQDLSVAALGRRAEALVKPGDG